MGTVSSTNAALTNLMQTLSSAGSLLASPALSTPAIQKALQNASPGDIAKLSDAALQLRQTSAMFGVSDTADSTDPLTNLISSLKAPAAGAGEAQTKSTSSAADRLSVAQAALQMEQTAALFGTKAGTPVKSLFNVIG